MLARRFDVFRSRHFWGGGDRLLLFLPHLAWQHAHGWPTLEFMANARHEKMLPLSPLGFVLGALDQTLPVAWLWLLGVAWLLVARRAARLQALGFAFLGVVGVLALAGGKPYYLAAAYALAFAAGACAVEGWTAGRAKPLRLVALVVVVGLGLLAAPLARPVLPEDTLVRYAAALGETPGTDERNAVGRLNQFFADMHGWRDLAEAAARVVRELPASDRAGLCVFGQNYGEAGAIEYFGRQLDLPPAISSHNNYWLWGAEHCTGRVLVVIGGRRERLAELFEPGGQSGASHAARTACPTRTVFPSGSYAAPGARSPWSGRRSSASSRLAAPPSLTGFGKGLILAAHGRGPPDDDFRLFGGSVADDDPKRRKKEAKLLAEQARSLDPWERYRTLVDALEEAMDLVELADRKARFALVIMGALNIAFFFLVTRVELIDVLPPSTAALSRFLPADLRRRSALLLPGGDRGAQAAPLPAAPALPGGGGRRALPRGAALLRGRRAA